MKAAIVTFVRAYNYGATLQCYALSKKLRDMSVDVEVLDYSPQYFRDSYNLAYLGPLRLLPYRPLKSWWELTPLRRIIKKRNEGFDKFISKNIPLSSQQYHSIDELNTQSLPYDMYISGSDQVWSSICVPFDPVYFLQFASATKEKRYSYAASFGMNSVPEKYEAEYKRRLTDWTGYCVREASAATLLKSLVGVEATQCCDPTLLLTQKEWELVASAKKPRTPYILVYTVNKSKQLLEQAAQLSREKRLPVYVTATYMTHECLLGKEEKTYGFRMCPSTSPAEWLQMFFSAEYVLTDSFHGTVFSLIGHKKLLVVCDRPNIRSQELLQKVGLPSRYLPSKVSEIDTSVDWDAVDSVFSQLRVSSLKYLQSILDHRRSSMKISTK